MTFIGISLIAAVAWVALLKSDILIARLRVQTAADIAALSAAQSGCAAAAVIAAANQARLESCLVERATLGARVRACADLHMGVLPRFTLCTRARAGIQAERSSSPDG